jgi:hypothetical protein
VRRGFRLHGREEEGEEEGEEGLLLQGREKEGEEGVRLQGRGGGEGRMKGRICVVVIVEERIRDRDYILCVEFYS